MKKKVIMFQLPFQQFRSIKTWGNTPMGAAMLCGMALQEGLGERFDFEILPSSIVNHAGDAWLVDFLEGKQPDIICATLYLWNSRRSLHIAEQLKARLPNLLFVVGGPEVSEDSPYIIENQVVDYGCMGEGEELFVSILRAIDEERVPPAAPGLVVRREGGTIITPGRGAVGNLKRIPSPLKAGILAPKNEPIVPYETMRGCPCSCSYCITGSLRWRFFPATRVVEDLSILHDIRVKNVRLVCSNFLLHPEFFTICEELARVNADRCVSFSCFAYGGDVTRERAEALKACNFGKVETGLQTVNAPTLKNIRRPSFDEARFLAGLDYLRDAGIDCSVDLIAGLPGESAEDIERSIDFVKNSRIRHFNVFPLLLLPGSPLKKRAVEMGIEADPLPPYRVIETATLTRAQMHTLVRKGETERKDFFFNLAQEFSFPRFCAFNHGGSLDLKPSRSHIPVTKLLVSRSVDTQRFADAAVRGFGSCVVLIFSNLKSSLPSYREIVESLCRTNPFCLIMPVFCVRATDELGAAMRECRRVSGPNLTHKTIVRGASVSCEPASAAEDITFYDEVHIGSPGDLERVSSCANRNVLVDLSPEQDAAALRALIVQLLASGKNIQYKNFAFYYLDYLVRQMGRGRPAHIHAPVDMGSIASLDADGGLIPHISLNDRLALEIAHMQALFTRWGFPVQGSSRGLDTGL